MREGGSLIFHHFPSFQQFFFLASKWPNSSRNAKKKISIFGDPPSYSASSQAFYVKILNIWLKNFWKKHLLQNLLKAWSWCQKELLCIFHHESKPQWWKFHHLFLFCAFPNTDCAVCWVIENGYFGILLTHVLLTRNALVVPRLELWQGGEDEAEGGDHHEHAGDHGHHLHHRHNQARALRQGNDAVQTLLPQPNPW